MDGEKARQWLIGRLAELKAEVQVNAEARNPVTLEQDSVGRLSRMDAMQQQAMAQAAQRRREAEQDRIHAALKRLDEGEWGFCLSCGENIAEARLRHDPAAAQCVGCASTG